MKQKKKLCFWVRRPRVSEQGVFSVYLFSKLQGGRQGFQQSCPRQRKKKLQHRFAALFSEFAHAEEAISFQNSAFKNVPCYSMLCNHKLLRTRKTMDNSTFIHFFPIWNPQAASDRQKLVIRRMPAISYIHKQLYLSWNSCCIQIFQPGTWKKCHLTSHWVSHWEGAGFNWQLYSR